MKIIFTCERVERSVRENARFHKLVREYLGRTGLKYSRCAGKYMYITEASYAVESELTPELVAIATLFHQESILLVDDDREASLYFIDEKKYLEMGHYTRTSKAKANLAPAYTCENGVYYICGK